MTVESSSNANTGGSPPSSLGTAEGLRVILAPGNGCPGNSLEGIMWYPWIRDQVLATFPADKVAFPLKAFPDPCFARFEVWQPFMDGLCEGRQHSSIVIGHSSGAVAALRFAERHAVLGIVLCSAYDSDLGCDVEARSNNFKTPFNWAQIKANCQFIVQLHSKNDHLVDFAVGERVAASLGLSEADRTFIVLQDGHFQNDTFPELWNVVRERLQAAMRPS
jgi:predicted alpha/beta hydrolase family esterase